MGLQDDSELLELIDSIVAKNTFSLEALESVKRLKDKVKSQSNLIEKLEKYNDDLNVENKNWQTKFRAESEKASEYKSKYEELLKQEDAAKKAIYEAEKQAAVANAYKDAMSIVFKPAFVRESVVANKQIMTPGGYSQMVPENSSVERSFE